MKKLVFFFIFTNIVLFAYSVEDGTEAMLEGNYSKAATVWRSLLKSKPGNVTYSYNLALCYEHLGQLERALQYYKRAVSLNPGKIKGKIAKIEKIIEHRKKQKEERRKQMEQEKNRKNMLTLASKFGRAIKENTTDFNFANTEVKSAEYASSKYNGRRYIVYGLYLVGFLFLIFLSYRYLIKKRKKSTSTYQSGWQKLSLLLKNKTVNGMYTFRENEDIGVIFFVDGSIASAYYTTLKDGITIKGENAVDLITEMKNPEIKFVPYVKDVLISEREKIQPKKVVNIFDD